MTEPGRKTALLIAGSRLLCRRVQTLLRAVLGWALVATSPLGASDHLDMRNPFAVDCDLSDLYAFVSPSDPAKVVLVLNVHPMVGADARFLPDLEFAVGAHAAAPQQGSVAKFALSGSERRFHCVFDEPADNPDKTQSGRCVSPTGHAVTVDFDDPAGARGPGFRVFAGRRSDPFFMAANTVTKEIEIPNFLSNFANLPNPGSNDAAGRNVLSIVIEADAALLGEGLVAVRAEALVNSSRKREDAVGRPEITNMVVGFFNLFLKGGFNEQDAFSSQRADRAKYIERFSSRLARWDGRDDRTDWPLANDLHPLTELLYDDFLVLDLSKPFTDSGYLEIEKSVVDGTAHRTSGGRWVGEDVIDVFLSYYIARDKKSYSDHVDRATKPPIRRFPYLADPN